jgi:hypothetical protein
VGRETLAGWDTSAYLEMWAEPGNNSRYSATEGMVAGSRSACKVRQGMQVDTGSSRCSGIVSGTEEAQKGSVEVHKRTEESSV